jgi:AcrR family transcriptional regulator
MGVLERRNREKLQRRRDIMNAAKEVFFAKGLKMATMDEIAEKAELSKGTLYLYFQSKEELYLSLLEEGNKIFLEIISNEVSPNLTASEQLIRLSNAYYKFYRDYHQFFEIMFFLQHGEFPKEKISNVLYCNCMDQANNTLKLLEKIITKGVNDGEFKNVDTWKMALFIWSAATGIFSILKEKDHREFVGDIDEKSLLDFAVKSIVDILKKE